MGELKSAYEKAMERAERLGKLSPEEMKETKRVEFEPVGRALAERYLVHGHSGLLREEIDKYSGEEREIVLRASLSRLAEAIELEDHEITRRAVGGLLDLTGDERIREINERITALIADYDQAKEKRYEEEKAEVERGVREVMHQLRISGSAVGEVNLEAGQAWRKALEELHSRFDMGMEGLRGELAGLF